jgi:glycogen(starch) synthase
MTPPRVLMTADAVGGVWTYALELTRALSAARIATTLVTMGPPPDRDRLTAALAIEGVEVIPTNFALEWMDGGSADADAAAEWLLALEGRVRPSLVHLNGYSFGSLPWRAPVVVVGHSCVVSWNDAVGGGVDAEWLARYRAAVTRGVRAADWVVAPTAAMLQTLQRLYGPLQCASVISNGRDPATCRPLEKQPLVVAAGRLWDRAKNIDAVKAIEDRLSWPVCIAGDTAVGRGRLPERDLLALLGRASILAAPARYEPFGLLPLEAALCGCALVLGDIASLREIWEDAALYVNPDNTESLRASIEGLIAEPDRLERLASAARARALRFTTAAMGQQYLSLFRALTGVPVDLRRLACAS